MAELYTAFPVPAGVYGLFLLLMLLCGGILKLEQVEGAGNLLLDIMSVMFVPSAVGLMDSYHQLQSALVPIVCICVVSTIIVMVATGKAAQFIIGRKVKKRKAAKPMNFPQKSLYFGAFSAF